MTDTQNKCQIDDTQECCSSADVGIIIDNDNCVVEYTNSFASKKEAQVKQEQLTKLAEEIASEPCQILSDITENAEQYGLKMTFQFSYGAESLIFQLKLR